PPQLQAFFQINPGAVVIAQLIAEDAQIVESESCLLRLLQATELLQAVEHVCFSDFIHAQAEGEPAMSQAEHTEHDLLLARGGILQGADCLFKQMRRFLQPAPYSIKVEQTVERIAYGLIILVADCLPPRCTNILVVGLQRGHCLSLPADFQIHAMPM